MSRTFLDVVVSLYPYNNGALADDGHTFIREIGRRAALCTTDPRETTFLYQRFSIAIQRFNSICLANSFLISEYSG